MSFTFDFYQCGVLCLSTDILDALWNGLIPYQFFLKK